MKKVDPRKIDPNEELTKDIEDKYLSFVFPRWYPWRNSKELSYKVIHILSAGRPRWSLQLCRLAVQYSMRLKSDNKPKIINFFLLTKILKNYGRLKLIDMIREHNHQCKQIEDVLYTFVTQNKIFTKTKLLNFIRIQLVDNTNIFLDNSDKKANEEEIANFLFQVR